MIKLILALILLTQPAFAAFHVFGSGGGAVSKLPRVDKRIEVGTSWRWFKYDPILKKYDYSKIDEAVVRRTGKNYPVSTIMNIDIENFAADDFGNSQLLRVIEIIREENPTIRLGYYGEFPHQNYWGRVPHRKNMELLAAGKEPVNHFSVLARHTAAWDADLKRKHLAEKVDIIFPSCYTFYRDATKTVALDPNVRDWELYCQDQIESARRYGKAIYVFLWPLYHPNGAANPPHKQVEGEYFKRQLELAHKYADGVVIWEGGLTAADLTGAWWTETVKFLDAKGLYLP